MAEIGAFRDPIKGKHDKKGVERYPWRLVFLFWAWKVQRSKSVLHSGLGFPFILMKEKRKEKNWGEKKSKEGERKVWGLGNRATARGRGQWKPCVETGKLIPQPS